MELTLGTGLYRPIMAKLIQDINRNFYTKHIIDYTMTMQYASVVNSGANNLVKAGTSTYSMELDHATIKDIPITEVGMNPSMSFGCPGYLYIKGSLSELRDIGYSISILVELETKDDHRIIAVFYPKQIGYNFDVPTSLHGDDIADFLCTDMNILISMPAPIRSNELFIPEYIGSGVCRYSSYPIIENLEVDDGES